MGSKTFRPPVQPDLDEGLCGKAEGVNYVVACWGGQRRKGGQPHDILASHLDSLHRLRHDLSQVVLCVPECEDETPEFRSMIRSLPATIGGARLTVLERPNRGLSYGSWSDAFSVWRGRFRHHFFMEDDFAFCRHGFDAEMIRVLEASGGRGCLVGGVSDCKTYAEISNFVAADGDLQMVWRSHGGHLPHLPAVGYKGDCSQSAFGQGFWRIGLPFHDLRKHYGVTFKEAPGVFREWPHPAGRMMVAIEHWEGMGDEELRDQGVPVRGGVAAGAGDAGG